MRTLLASCLVLSAVGLAHAEPKAVKPNKDWTGVMKDDTQKKLAPKDGFIVEAKEFEKLWKAWRTDEKLPEIDFTKEVVVVTLASGPNYPRISAKLDEGTLEINAISTLIGGEGFGYSIATFDRKGITKVGTKKLPAK